MKAIEFIAIPANGYIRLPESLKEIDSNAKVKVIVLYEEEKKRTGSSEEKNFLAELIEKPLKIKKFKPLTRKEIYE